MEGYVLVWTSMVLLYCNRNPLCCSSCIFGFSLLLFPKWVYIMAVGWLSKAVQRLRRARSIR